MLTSDYPLLSSNEMTAQGRHIRNTVDRLDRDAGFPVNFPKVCFGSPKTNKSALQRVGGVGLPGFVLVQLLDFFRGDGLVRRIESPLVWQ